MTVKVLVTGAKGFLGTHLVRALSEMTNIDVITFCRNDEPKSLDTKLVQASFIFHLAGVNRSQNKDDFAVCNVNLTAKITDILYENRVGVPIYFSSSIHAGLFNEYGESKLACEVLMNDLKNKNGNLVIVDQLVRVFGPEAKPNFNSAVATFCHAIANDVPFIVSDPEIIIQLTYVKDWVQKMLELVKEPTMNIGIEKYEISLGALCDLLLGFKLGKRNYSGDLNDELVKKLLVTYEYYENFVGR